MSIHRKICDDINELSGTLQNIGCFCSFDDIAVLPEPVKRYFCFAVAEHSKPINSVSTKFTGLFCIKRQGQWLPINGEDYYTVNFPEFAWLAEVKINPLFWLTVKDSYIQAKGKAQVKAYSLVTVATATGPGIDQGALSRWLGSAVLFPEALLPSRKTSWEHIDENSARLIFSHEGIEIIAVVYFGRKGEIVRIVTDRYCYETRNFEKWSAYYKSYTDYNGRKIPTEVGAVWHFATGNFHYARFHFTSIEFDKSSLTK